MQKPRIAKKKKASKPNPLTHKHKASLKHLKKRAKSHIINALSTSFVRSVRGSICPRAFSHRPRSFVARSLRKPQANTFPYRPHTRLSDHKYIYMLPSATASIAQLAEHRTRFAGWRKPKGRSQKLHFRNRSGLGWVLKLRCLGTRDFPSS